LEDLGDVTLTQACRGGTGPETPEFYRQAIEILVRMQAKASFPANPACLAFSRVFDVPLLMWEFDHFIEYGIERRLGRALPDEDRQVIRTEMQLIAQELAVQPRIFTHRDYHSRNLMVQDGRLRVLDFQDALMGPATYDLASLLRDSYASLDEALIDDLLAQYLDSLAKANVPLDHTQFRRLFDLTSIQRNLKAAGRFVYIDQVKKNPNFLAAIPRTLGYVKRTLEKYRSLASLQTMLAKHVPELQ
jgi:hypothetical protein